MILQIWWNVFALTICDEGYCLGSLLANDNYRKERLSISSFLIPTGLKSHERGKDREVLTTSGTDPWSFVTQIFHNGQPNRGGDRKTFEVRTST